MAELLSVQVHAPVQLTSVNVTSSPTSAGPAAPPSAAVDMMDSSAAAAAAGPPARRLKKVDNAASSSCRQTDSTGTQPPRGGTTFDYLPKRRTVNIEFDQLTYSVSEGRKKGKHSRLIGYMYSLHVRLITTSDPIGLKWHHIGPHRTLSDHIDLKQHHIGRTCIGLNAVRRLASN